MTRSDLRGFLAANIVDQHYAGLVDRLAKMEESGGPLNLFGIPGFTVERLNFIKPTLRHYQR